jgi:beta-glucanase (GH16 family)
MHRKAFIKKGFMAFSSFLLVISMIMNGTFAATLLPNSAKLLMDLPATHWAYQAINRLKDFGIINGYPDGTLRPNNPITRVEFAAIINRLFGYESSSSLLIADTTAGSWAQKEMSKAVEAGYLQLDSTHKANPNEPLDRAQTAKALAFIYQLKEATSDKKINFNDIVGLDKTTTSAISLLVGGGYVKGFADGTFRPEKTISRSELAALIDRLTGLLVQSEGTVTAGMVHGNVIVNHAGALLKDTVIEGNLYLTPGIGQGDAHLNNVTVKGSTFVQGGGVNSIGFIDSTLADVQVNKIDGKVRIYTEGSTSVDQIQLSSGAIVESNSKDGPGVRNVVLSTPSDSVQLNGHFVKVTTQAGQSSEEAVTLYINGTVDQLILNGKTKVILGENAQVKQLILSEGADASSIEGKGKIDTIENHANGVLRDGTILPTTGSSSSGSSSSSGGIDPWTLAWSDEFNDDTIDPNKWTYDTSNGVTVGNPGWGNNELEYYTSRPENVKVENGKLVITAIKENYEGFQYTSARIKTKGKFSQTYGKYEIRAKAPVGKGFWPAIWMLPEDYVYGAWAASGEIDIMEGWGSKPDTIAGTLHYGQQWPGNTYTGKEYKFGSSTIEQFHTYAIEWEPGEIRWYVDGQLYNTQNDWYSRSADQPANNTYPAPFDQNFHLLMNLAVGGNFDGNPTADTLFPSKMEIDYVRVYELTGRSYRDPIPPTLAKENYQAGSNLPQAPDNDLVYNKSFTQNVDGDTGMGIPDTAHWSLFQEPGGSAATVAIDPLSGVRYAKVNITNGGSNPYSIQPQAIVSLAKGRYYKLSFDAKTDTSRNINVKLTGGQSRGYAAYSQALQADLTSGFKSYEMSFQMKQDSDIAARIEFNMGTNTHPVWFGNVKLVEIDSILFDHDAAKEPYGADGNHIYNGTFDQGELNRLSYWHLFTSGGAAATATVSASERKLNLAITNGGSAAYQVQLVQKGINLINGQQYQLTFSGSSDAARVIAVQLLSKDGTEVYAEHNVYLTGDEGGQSFSFTMNSATTEEAQFAILAGGASGGLNLDNFKLVRTSIYLDPNVVKFPLINGQFDGDLAAWQNVGLDGGSVTASVYSSSAKLAIGEVGPNPWSIMLFQDTLNVSNGVRYLVEFDAYSTTNRKMEVILENASYNRSFDQTVDLTATKKRYQFEFTKAGNETVALKFLLGKIAGDNVLGAHNVFIDNVVIEPKGAIALSNHLTNGTFDNDTSGWTNFFYDGAGVTGTVSADSGRIKASLSGSGGEAWNAQLDYENLTVEQGKSYRLTFDAKSSVDRNIQVTVEHKGGDYTKYLEPQLITLTSTATTFSYTFTVISSATDSGAHLNFLLGQIDANIAVSHDISFDNISLIEVTMPPTEPPEGHDLLNGSFDSNVDNWTTYKADGSNAVASIDNQKLKVDFTTYDGWFTYSTQVFQNHLQLEDGKTYVLAFEASSSLNKSVSVELTKGSSGSHLAAQSLSLTANPEQYSYEFTVIGGADPNAKLNFLLGSNNVKGENFVAHSIWIDNITLVVKP